MANKESERKTDAAGDRERERERGTLQHELSEGLAGWPRVTVLGVVQNCHHFQKSTQSKLREGVNGHFLKC